jgi:hypothetical protein
MTTYTYSKPYSHGDPSGLVVYLDKTLRIPAPVSVNGVPASGSKIDRDNNGDFPTFTSTIAPLYVRAPNGGSVALQPQLNFASPLNVTGAKGGNVALGNLITALIAAGVPITDSTT